LNSFVFHTEGKNTKEVDATKALFVPAGMNECIAHHLNSWCDFLMYMLGTDLYEDIGLPKGARRQDFDEGSFEKRLKQWSKVTAEYYPPTGECEP